MKVAFDVQPSSLTLTLENGGAKVVLVQLNPYGELSDEIVGAEKVPWRVRYALELAHTGIYMFPIGVCPS